MSRLSARIVAVVLAAGLAADLAACAPATEPPPLAATPPSSTAAFGAKIPPPQSPPAAHARTVARAVAPTATPTPPPAQAAPDTPDTPAWAPPFPGPKHLLGLDGGRVSQLLGPPDFRRQDNPAEIWQYRSAACVLDLFLYGGRGGAGGRVTHVEMRDLGRRPVPEADCLRALFKDRPRAGG